MEIYCGSLNNTGSKFFLMVGLTRTPLGLGSKVDMEMRVSDLWQCHWIWQAMVEAGWRDHGAAFSFWILKKWLLGDVLELSQEGIAWYPGWWHNLIKQLLNVHCDKLSGLRHSTLESVSAQSSCSYESDSNCFFANCLKSACISNPLSLNTCLNSS